MAILQDKPNQLELGRF